MKPVTFPNNTQHYHLLSFQTWGESCISLGRNTAQSFEQGGNDVSWNFNCRGDSKQSWALRFALSVTFSSGHILDSLLRQNISLWLD